MNIQDIEAEEIYSFNSCMVQLKYTEGSNFRRAFGFNSCMVQLK